MGRRIRKVTVVWVGTSPPCHCVRSSTRCCGRWMQGGGDRPNPNLVEGPALWAEEPGATRSWGAQEPLLWRPVKPVRPIGSFADAGGLMAAGDAARVGRDQGAGTFS